MKFTALIISILILPLTLSSQQETVKLKIAQITDELEIFETLQDIPDNYTDYHFGWNGTTSNWDSSDVARGEFWGTPDNINMRYSVRYREYGTLVDGDWIETYNLNLEAGNTLDPIARYTYFPCDSLRSVVNAPFFGLFPLSSYFTSTDQGKLHTEESFIDYALIGDPQAGTYWLGKSTNNYNSEQKLVSQMVDWEGLDSTYFEYNSDGLIARSVQALGYYGNTPEEYTVTDFGYDNDNRLVYEVTSYYLDSLVTIDFRDSVAYIYTGGEDYTSEQYNYDIYSHNYEFYSAANYIFEADSASVIELRSIQLGQIYTYEIQRTSYDEQGRFTHRLTTKAFTPSMPMVNSELVIRSYDKTTANETVQPQKPNEIKWHQNGQTLDIWMDNPSEGKYILSSSDGRLVDARNTYDGTASINIGNLPYGVYFLAYTNNNEHTLSTQGIYLH